MIEIRKFLLLCLLLAGGQLFSLEVNIIAWNNGVGLTNDFKILNEELTKLGHHVNHIDPSAGRASQADINIFIEHNYNDFWKFASKNYFIPNPEWCYLSQEQIQAFDLILCRTAEVERIFQSITGKTYYLGFTSKDRYNTNVKKNFNHFLHLKGLSKTKGTKPLLNLWKKKTDLPELTVIAPGSKNPLLDKVDFKKKYLSEQTLERYLNQCGVHLCPSETEGFGHYLSEAMSIGAVVVTTNAPPMNEFITDSRCLVKYKSTEQQRYATKYFIDPKDMERVIRKLSKLSKKELRRIGLNNRQRYLENKQAFQVRLQQLMELPSELTKDTSMNLSDDATF